jgi:hypothetical protein
MSTKDDYTDAEWTAISTAPVAAGLLITSSDASAAAKHAMTVGRVISTSLRGAPEIVVAVANNIKAGAPIPDVPNFPAGTHAQTNAALIGIVEAAVRALQTKSPGETERYKAWLAAVTAKVSCESKLERAVDLARPLVNADEAKAVQQLADVLGVSVQARV